MTDLRLAEPAWDERRARAAFDGMVRRRRGRRLARVTLVALMAIVALASVRLRLRSRVVEFADGSTAQLLDRDSAVSEGPRAAALVTARLESGRARFVVVHDPRRRFRVEVGAVSVEDLGTRFTLEKEGSRARVTVEEGRVRVSWGQGAVELAAGEGGRFPPDDEVALLWKEADAARRQGRPGDALAPLSRIVHHHARDPRAPLAAFTMGRLYLDEMHRPAEAAAAFALARTLAPDGPLAADARVREAQARGAK
jgi:ferric-dicitrate binding protein FerR (iron transport regulator)